MNSLPRAMKRDTGIIVYRGIRDDSRAEVYSFWAVDESYAASYGGGVIEGQISNEAIILDITEMIDAAGDISGASLDAAIPGLADAMGIDDESSIEADRLWDAAGDDLSRVVELLNDHAFDGFRWVEQDLAETYMLIH